MFWWSVDGPKYVSEKSRLMPVFCDCILDCDYIFRYERILSFMTKSSHIQGPQDIILDSGNEKHVVTLWINGYK